MEEENMNLMTAFWITMGIIAGGAFAAWLIAMKSIRDEKREKANKS